MTLRQLEDLCDWLENHRPRREPVLVLTREVGERIVIGEGIVVTVISATPRGKVRIGIEADRSVPVLREELSRKGAPSPWRDESLGEAG